MSMLARKRLSQEARQLFKEPAPLIRAKPNDKNILEFHYVIEGPEDSVYAGGWYHGKLRFPPEYPFKPPSILMITPNGRFQTNTRLCLSISDYHPDTWSPNWSVRSILIGLLSFMLESTQTAGSMETSDAAKRAMAKASLAHNIGNPTFCKLFPELVEKYRKQYAEAQAAAGAGAAGEGGGGGGGADSSTDAANATGAGAGAGVGAAGLKRRGTGAAAERGTAAVAPRGGAKAAGGGGGQGGALFFGVVLLLVVLALFFHRKSSGDPTSTAAGVLP